MTNWTQANWHWTDFLSLWLEAKWECVAEGREYCEFNPETAVRFYALNAFTE